MKEFELSFRNPEVKMYAAVVLPAVTIGLLMILLSNSDLNFMYAAAVQAIGLLSFYMWRLFYRRKEKL
ncbi:hypothetical protein [Sporosarcina sp.]|uniref:hypothetical protein n=1 Tax=Sporosarcina sp. TaxID=49982 RepID=UPI00260DFCDF|nr:hypothetical protein [Sporosarcina sp.]